MTPKQQAAVRGIEEAELPASIMVAQITLQWRRLHRLDAKLALDLARQLPAIAFGPSRLR